MTDVAPRFDPQPHDLDAAADAALAACGGDARSAVKALISLNAELEDRLGRVSGAVSSGFTRGRAKPARG